MNKFICVNIKSCCTVFIWVIGHGWVPGQGKCIASQQFLVVKMLMGDITKEILHDFGNRLGMRKS